MKDLKFLVRRNIWELKPYSSARDEYKGKTANTFLDANESPYNISFNRYPDPLQWKLKEVIAEFKGVTKENIFLGNGSDEAIDLVYRIFCEPAVDNVVAIAPSYGMYEVCANINNVKYKRVLLDDNYQFKADDILKNIDQHTKVVFLCSPNNPSGNCLDVEEIEKVLKGFEGIVVIDEAYSDFSDKPIFRTRLKDFPNIIVLNTFSKAWASAAIRLGMAFASTDIIGLFNKVKYPYNVNQLTQNQAMKLLENRVEIDRWVKLILQERGALMEAVSELKPICKKVYPTDANFFLARFTDANDIYNYLVDKGIIIRNRSKIVLCDNCLRITIGTPQENNTFLAALRKYCIEHSQLQP